jgi:hypothetical protein
MEADYAVSYTDGKRQNRGAGETGFRPLAVRPLLVANREKQTSAMAREPCTGSIAPSFERQGLW